MNLQLKGFLKPPYVRAYYTICDLQVVLSVCVVLIVEVSCQQQGQQTEDNRVNGQQQQQQQQQQPCSPFQGCIQSPRLNFNPIDKFRSASRTFASAAKYLKDAIAYKKKLFSYF